MSLLHTGIGSSCVAPPRRARSPGGAAAPLDGSMQHMGALGGGEQARPFAPINAPNRPVSPQMPSAAVVATAAAQSFAPINPPNRPLSPQVPAVSQPAHPSGVDHVPAGLGPPGLGGVGGFPVLSGRGAGGAPAGQSQAQSPRLAAAAPGGPPGGGPPQTAGGGGGGGPTTGPTPHAAIGASNRTYKSMGSLAGLRSYAGAGAGQSYQSGMSYMYGYSLGV